MKTKYIFNLLALAMLMPAMLLTTACGNEDDVVNNTENIANKGYALPVTVNVTRQDAAATRATYIDNGDGTGSLAFSTDDKLFVKGYKNNAGYFAGTLTWQSGGTFSGTILTEKEYTGTIDALFTEGNTQATLLPAGYDSNNFLSINDQGTSVKYDDLISISKANAFVASETAKKTGVEQLSLEQAFKYSNGFALKPQNAVLNFTITRLAANTGVDVALSKGTDFTISGNVTTNVSGTATFAIGVYVDPDVSETTDLNEFSLKVGDIPIPLVSSSKVLAAGKIYNINRSAFTMAADATSADKGKEICTDGHIHANGADLGCTRARVAKIVYVGSDNGEAYPYNHGLALALDDVGTSCKWKKENTDAGHTKQTTSTFTEESGLQYNTMHNSEIGNYPAFQAAINYRMSYSPAAPTDCSAWFLASGYQWKKMADAVGGYDKLGLTGNANYWSSSELNETNAWYFYSGNGGWNGGNKVSEYRVRACLAF